MTSLTRLSVIHIAIVIWTSQSQDMVDPFGITSGHNPVPQKSDLNNSAGLPARPASCHHITDRHHPCMPRFRETFPVNVAFGPAGSSVLQFHLSSSRSATNDQTTTHHEMYSRPPTGACTSHDRFQWRSSHKIFEYYKMFIQSLHNRLGAERHQAAHNPFHDFYITSTRVFLNHSKPQRPHLNPENDNH